MRAAPELVIGDDAMGLWRALAEVFPAARPQRCWVHTVPQRREPPAQVRAARRDEGDAGDLPRRVPHYTRRKRSRRSRRPTGRRSRRPSRRSPRTGANCSPSTISPPNTEFTCGPQTPSSRAVRAGAGRPPTRGLRAASSGPPGAARCDQRAASALALPKGSASTHCWFSPSWPFHMTGRVPALASHGLSRVTLNAISRSKTVSAVKSMCSRRSWPLCGTTTPSW